MSVSAEVAEKEPDPGTVLRQLSPSECRREELRQSGWVSVTWKGTKPAGAHHKDSRAPGTKTGSRGSLGTCIKQLPQNIRGKASKSFLSDILPAD